MQKKWHLCEIDHYPRHEGNELKKTDNLSVKDPEFFVSEMLALLGGESATEMNAQGDGSWFVWLPVIPRVGDTLQFSGWQVQVSRVVLDADWTSRTGVKDDIFVSARISIRDDVIPGLTDAYFSVDQPSGNAVHKWETFARRGHDLQYFAWELRNESFLLADQQESGPEYLRWHTRVRPVAGDIINVKDVRWRVKSIELASANESVDGWLSLEVFG